LPVSAYQVKLRAVTVMFLYDLAGVVAVAFYPLGEYLAADINAGLELFFQPAQSFSR
jgi:hypothetical protein